MGNPFSPLPSPFLRYAILLNEFPLWQAAPFKDPKSSASYSGLPPLISS
jgi:hypothetical protein